MAFEFGSTKLDTDLLICILILGLVPHGLLLIPVWRQSSLSQAIYTGRRGTKQAIIIIWECVGFS